MKVPPRGKQLAVSSAVAGTPGGLRIATYPTTMLLVKMGLVEERPIPWGQHGQGRAWFPSRGRATIKVYGMDDA